jgi:hypothetical protein
MASVAVLGVLDVLGVALKPTLSVPCDPLEVMVSHVALGSGVELQVHALAAPTPTVPLPPLFGTVATDDPRV